MLLCELLLLECLGCVVCVIVVALFFEKKILVVRILFFCFRDSCFSVECKICVYDFIFRKYLEL